MTDVLVQTLSTPARRAASQAWPMRPWLATRMPRHVADSFTEAQLAALEHALEERSPRKPGLDIRLSIPLFRRRAYLVLFAGSERRSPERRDFDRTRHPLLTFANAGALLFGLFLAVPGFIGFCHLLASAYAAG